MPMPGQMSCGHYGCGEEFAFQPRPAHVEGSRPHDGRGNSHRNRFRLPLRSPLVALGLSAALLLAISADASHAGERVTFEDTGIARGTIVIHTTERRLFLLLGSGKAMAYPVGVGRADRQWTGLSSITGKYVRPNWAPPAAVKRDSPNLPDMIPGGAPNNPLGVAALTLAGGEYAIHGTNRPNSVGGFVSYGCIRMTNEDVVDLYDRVRVGTPVMVQR